jgi:hypothetical protein
LTAYLHRLWRRLVFGKPVVVVSGLPRSGTSMLMKMLEAGGIDLIVDGLRTADEDNPKGYYEDERVKDLTKEKDKAWLGEARGKTIKVISYLLKELPENHNYKVLLLRRNLKEVLASQAKMLERRGEPSEASDERMLELLEADLWKASYLLKHSARFEALELRYRDVLDDPTAQAERVNDFLGGSLDVGAMAEVVDPKLYRNRVEGLAGDEKTT